jgi:primosomal protein N'
MHSDEIKNSLSLLVTKMLAKGVIRPDVALIWNANAEPALMLQEARAGEAYLHDTLHYGEGSTFDAIFSSCFSFIEKLPSPEEKRMKNFMKAVATAIEVGRASDIDVEFLNPLQGMMKKLSDNIITDQRASAGAA